MTLVEIQHVINDLVLGIAVDVIAQRTGHIVDLEAVVLVSFARAEVGALGRNREELIAEHALIVQLNFEVELGKFDVGKLTGEQEGIVAAAAHVRCHLLEGVGSGFAQVGIHLLLGGEGIGAVEAALPEVGVGRFALGAGRNHAMHSGGAGLALDIFQAQRLPQREHDEVNHERERQAHDDGRGLHGGNAIDLQQGQGQCTHGHGPEDAQPAGTVLAVIGNAGGEVGHHQRAGVGRGDVEQQADERGQENDDGRARELLQHIVEALLRDVDRIFGEFGVVTGADHVQGGVAEEGHPHQDEQEREGEGAEDELAQGAAAGDAGQEETNEGRPSNPPCPEEEGPGLHPGIGGRLVLGEGKGLHGPRWELRDIVADIGHDGIEEVRGLAKDDDVNHQRDGQVDVELGEEANALIHAGYGREGRNSNGDDDERGLQTEALLKAEDEVNAVG